MTPNEVNAEMGEMSPVLVQILAAEYIVLLRQLLSREKGFIAACTRNDVRNARLHAERFVQALQDAVDNTMNGKLKEEWFANRGGLQMLQAVEDALRSARAGQRHWLTRLQKDTSPKTSQQADPPRSVIEARAAALLEVFGADDREGCAGRIAKTLAQSGFETKQGAPTKGTILQWRKLIKACAPTRDSQNPKKTIQRHHERRYEYYVRDEQYFRNVSLDEGLTDLTRACKRLTPRLLGARQPGV